MSSYKKQKIEMKKTLKVNSSSGTLTIQRNKSVDAKKVLHRKLQKVPRCQPQLPSESSDDSPQIQSTAKILGKDSKEFQGH